MNVGVETTLLWGGLACYAASASALLYRLLAGRAPGRTVLGLLGLGVLALAAVVALRWLRVGHGPFLSLFEILLSNLLTLGLVYALAYWRWPLLRPSATVALPILLLLGVWIVFVPRGATPLPPTYENPWLWVHVTMGKVFLGTCLVAVGLAGVLLARRWRVLPAGWLGGAPEPALDALAWRFLAVALLFHSLMLIAGAVWAQDAWGRYWAWDPLETWAFVTWLAMVVTLHLRVTYRVPQWLGWGLIVGVFALAFVTFFGVPFVSLAPHKGAV